MNIDILNLAKKRPVLLDGAMGTELMKRGFPQGACPESWNIEKPDVVRSIYESYFNAGSDAVLTNTLGANTMKLESFGLQSNAYEINRASAALARDVCPPGCYVGGSIGPTGKFIKPQGPYEESDIENAFIEQIKGLSSGGADFFMIETQYDLREAVCALRTACRHSSIPAFVTLTFNKTPRGYFTIMGNSLRQCTETLEKENVPAFGANCTLDSSEMAFLARELRSMTKEYLIMEANAGNPQIEENGNISYSQGIEDYVKCIPAMIEAGVNIIGGCCGTDPEYIRRMADLIKK